MRTAKRLAGLGIAAMCAATPVTAQVFQANSVLNSAMEVPTNASTATGFGIVTLNVGLNTLTVQESWTGLGSASAGAHIHCCSLPGVNSAVAIDFVGVNGFPTGTTSGTYFRTFDLLSASTYGTGFLNNATNAGIVLNARNTFVDGFLAGQTYLNLHTTLLPGGEIRGNLVNVSAVPEPATVALMATGLAGVGLVGRPRRRA